jgi:hypothetical protein
MALKRILFEKVGFAAANLVVKSPVLPHWAL